MSLFFGGMLELFEVKTKARFGTLQINSSISYKPGDLLPSARVAFEGKGGRVNSNIRRKEKEQKEESPNRGSAAPVGDPAFIWLI